MSRPDALRLSGALAQCDIALVLRDPVAAARSAQAARHASGLARGRGRGRGAARAGRDPAGRSPGADAVRKATQALVRAALIDAEAALLLSSATRARLAGLIAAADIDPAEANLLIAAEASPGLDVAAALAEVDGLAGRGPRAGGGARAAQPRACAATPRTTTTRATRSWTRCSSAAAACRSPSRR